MTDKYFKREDIKVGNEVAFKRTGVPDFDMFWTVTEFSSSRIKVKINEMGFNDELYIDFEDITHWHDTLPPQTK